MKTIFRFLKHFMDSSWRMTPLWRSQDSRLAWHVLCTVTQRNFALPVCMRDFQEENFDGLKPAFVNMFFKHLKKLNHRSQSPFSHLCYLSAPNLFVFHCEKRTTQDWCSPLFFPVTRIWSVLFYLAMSQTPEHYATLSISSIEKWQMMFLETKKDPNISHSSSTDTFALIMELSFSNR